MLKSIISSGLLVATLAVENIPTEQEVERATELMEQNSRDMFAGESCTLSNGNVLTAPAFVCNSLDRTKAREESQSWYSPTPEELKDYSCPPLPTIDHGALFCYDNFLAGTICIGVCENGWTIDQPNKKKRCVHKKTWQKTKAGKSPIKWSLAGQDLTCIRDYLASPCLENNGGCSHDCIDRGDGLAVCVCPCGHALGSDGVSCEQSIVCPFDVSFWLDGSQNTCNDATFQEKQKVHFAEIVDFFGREVRSYDGRVAGGGYAAGLVDGEISNFDSTDVDQIVADIGEFEGSCGVSTAGNVFNHFTNDRVQDAATVAFIAMAGELTDSDVDLLLNRPKNIDNIIIVAQNTSTTEKYLEQTSLLGCGDKSFADCFSVIMIDDGIDAGTIESRVNRERCYDRTFSSSISCSEFHLEIDIPKCALRGLELDDIIFNSGLDGDCGAEKVNNGSHLQWKINYNDCGTIRTVSEDGTVSYTNALKTYFNDNGAVYPVLPMFDVPLRCDLHSKYEFIFHGDYYPTLTNFQADIETAVLLTGNLGVFLDEEFTSLVTNETYVETGIPLYVQSEVDMGSIENDLQLISCISSADELEEMAAVNGGDTWPLITEGCLVDTTVSMMPRGPDGEVRFNFESFKFQNSEDGHVVNIQCQYTSCLEGTCDAVQECKNTSDRRRRTPVKTQALNLNL